MGKVDHGLDNSVERCTRQGDMEGMDRSPKRRSLGKRLLIATVIGFAPLAVGLAQFLWFTRWLQYPNGAAGFYLAIAVALTAASLFGAGAYLYVSSKE